jgi:hypothetical protein
MTDKSLIHRCVSDARLRRALGLAVIFVVSLLTSCQERQPPQTGSVQLKGSETLRPLLTMSADFVPSPCRALPMESGGLPSP